MQNSYKVTLGMLTIMILLTLTVGTSYSYYTISGKSIDANTIKTTCFNVSYTDTGSNAINLTNSYPMSDGTGLAKDPYTFTVTNTCTSADANKSTHYVVTLSTLNTAGHTSDLTQYLRYRFDLGSTPGTIKTFDSTSTSKYTINNNVVPSTANVSALAENYILYEGDLAVGAHQTFNLRLWIAENACEGEACNTTVMGKRFEGKIVVFSSM